jgi:hypothetical protein
MEVYSKTLECGYKVIPYITDGSVNTNISADDFMVCMDTLLELQIDSVGDRLTNNYRVDKLNLNQMVLFNIVVDTYNNPILVSGCQQLSDNVIRVFSRYYSFTHFRTDGSILLDKIDNFDEFKYSLDHIDAKLIIWSRDRGGGFFKRLIRCRGDIFGGWIIHPTAIAIKSKDNKQFIFYTGDPSYLSEITA